MLEQPFFADAESIEAGMPKFDLHGLSAGAAEMVVRCWLRDELPKRLAAGKMSAPTQVVLVTGLASRACTGTGVSSSTEGARACQRARYCGGSIEPRARRA